MAEDILAQLSINLIPARRSPMCLLRIGRGILPIGRPI